jgi:hypothetical protein
MYSSYLVSRSPEQEDLFLSSTARRIPAVFPYSGVAVRPDLLVEVGELNKSLCAGAFNYWFMRDWAKWSLGHDVPEVADALPGSELLFKVYEPRIGDIFPSLPLAADQEPSFCFGSDVQVALEGEVLQGKSLDRKMLVPCISFGTQWLRSGPLRLRGRHCEMAFSHFKFYSTHAYFEGSIKGLCQEFQMPLVDVPLTPFEIVKGRISYCRSELASEKELPYWDLLNSGYMFRYIVAENTVYYTNSVACYYGLPPVAEALQWPQLKLESLPADWRTEVVGGGVMSFGPKIAL